MAMQEFEFTLRFRLPAPDTDPESLLPALVAAGCDDATIGIGKRGHLAMTFTRSGSTLAEAIASAIRDVESAIPGAQLVEATPDSL